MIISAFENKKTCICKVLTEFEVLLTLDGISDTGGKYGGVDLYFNSSLDRYLLFSLKNIDVKYPTPQTNRAAACADNCAPDSFVANFEMYAFVARAGVDSALNCIITALTECCIKFGRITTDKYSVIEKILKSKKGVDIFNSDNKITERAKGVAASNYVLLHIDNIELYLEPESTNGDCVCIICDC